MEKEFNTWFIISFFYCGKCFERTIHLSSVKIDGDTWFYNDTINVRGDEYKIEVWGTYDDYGNVRTSGSCLVDGNEIPAGFGINVMDEDGDVIAYIDDIDIIDCD